MFGVMMLLGLTVTSAGVLSLITPAWWLVTYQSVTGAWTQWEIAEQINHQTSNKLSPANSISAVLWLKLCSCYLFRHINPYHITPLHLNVRQLRPLKPNLCLIINIDWSELTHIPPLRVVPISVIITLLPGHHHTPTTTAQTDCCQN